MILLYCNDVVTVTYMLLFHYFQYLISIYMYGIICHLSGAPEFTPSIQWGLCYSIFSFICLFCRSLFILLYFFFWPLCCLFFFDIWILITPLVSSSFSKICMWQIFIQSILFNLLDFVVEIPVVTFVTLTTKYSKQLVKQYHCAHY